MSSSHIWRQQVPLKTARMIPAASENWEEVSLLVLPLQELFLGRRATSNAEAASQEQEKSQEKSSVSTKKGSG